MHGVFLGTHKITEKHLNYSPCVITLFLIASNMSRFYIKRWTWCFTYTTSVICFCEIVYAWKSCIWVKLCVCCRLLSMQLLSSLWIKLLCAGSVTQSQQMQQTHCWAGKVCHHLLVTPHALGILPHSVDRQREPFQFTNSEAESVSRTWQWRRCC